MYSTFSYFARFAGVAQDILTLHLHGQGLKDSKSLLFCCFLPIRLRRDSTERWIPVKGSFDMARPGHLQMRLILRSWSMLFHCRDLRRCTVDCFEVWDGFVTSLPLFFPHFLSPLNSVDTFRVRHKIILIRETFESALLRIFPSINEPLLRSKKERLPPD